VPDCRQSDSADRNAALREQSRPDAEIALHRLTAALAAAGSLPAAADQRDRVRLAMNPGVYSFLPIFLAVDKGYFAKQNVDVQITRLTAVR
jgi:ABC-type nitrate/sulfonate/bicarbonate transport system substrate-binding protein